MERIVRFSAAYDKRHDAPKKNHGIGGVDIRFVLKGEEGAVHFWLLTGWNLPHVKEEMIDKERHSTLAAIYPIPAELGYHSPTPRHEGHHQAQEECEWLDGKPCYCGGASLAADPVFQRLLQEGDEGVWTELKDYYEETFGEDRRES